MNATAPRRRARPGFTLVEILVVIAIIGLLVALLLPAINAAVKTARGAAVQAEINQIAQALADFKSKFGDFPPSRIALNENGYYALTTGGNGVATSGGIDPTGAGSDVQLGLLFQRSVTALRKFWPRVSLTPTPNVVNWYDFDGDGNAAYNTTNGTPTKTYILHGHECLVFFLGGIPTRDASGAILGMSGFSKDPTNPFKNPNNAAGGANRNPPLMEFSAGRLVLNAQGMPGYTDTLNTSPSGNLGFYAYFSTNNGMGYDPNDVNNPAESDTNGVSPVTVTFASNQPVYNATGGAVVPSATASPSPNPYTTGLTTGGGASVAYQNPQSFQIISPGVDGVYGGGGLYATNGNADSLAPQASSNTTDRTMEYDNLTNFHQGRLR